MTQETSEKREFDIKDYLEGGNGGLTQSEQADVHINSLLGELEEAYRSFWLRADLDEDCSLNTLKESIEKRMHKTSV